VHLGIVELCEKNHHSMIYNWIKIANINNWKITLFTTEKIFKNVENEIKELNFELVLQNENTFIFLKNMKQKYKDEKIDKIIFLSITCGFLPLLFTSFKGINFGITIHNANVWFKNNTIRKMSHILKRFIRKRLKNQASFFIVNSNNMKNYIEENFRISKPLYVLPFSLKKSEYEKTSNYSFTVVYPGSVNVARKKYDNFIKLAQNNKNDKFILLGSYVVGKDNEDIFKKMKELSNIEVFESYVPLELFDEIISKADLLFSDIVVDFNLSDLSEIYGVTKDSGISYLMIQFNKLSLLNKEFINLMELEQSSIYFSNYEELVNKYNNLKENKIAIVEQESLQRLDTENFTVAYYADIFKELDL